MRNLVLAISVIILFGCKSVPPPVVETYTKTGEPVSEIKIPETASRSDVPAGVAPREVEAKVTTPSGAKIWVVKKHSVLPFLEIPSFYANKQAIAEGFKVEQPKDPWWKYPLIVLIVIGLIALGIFFREIKSIIFFWKR